MKHHNVKKNVGGNEMPILRPILTLVRNDDRRFYDEDRLYWAWKVVQINNIEVSSKRRDIFVNNTFDSIGYSHRGAKWIYDYKKENLDGSVEISNIGFKYHIFQKELKTLCTFLNNKQQKTEDITHMKKDHLELKVGSTYKTQNGAKVKIVAFEPIGNFAKHPTYVGLMVRDTNDGSTYRCNDKGEALSQGGHEHYNLISEIKELMVHTYVWFDGDDRYQTILYGPNPCIPECLSKLLDKQFQSSELANLVKWFQFTNVITL